MIKGIYKTRQVYINSKELSLEESLKHLNSSPTGFNWGYGGAGPEQLAFALLFEFFGLEIARHLYMSFKMDVIAKLPKKNFKLEEKEVMKYVKEKASQYFASLELN
ncbi:MAG: DUF6166 domain-containing protein [Actinobacteria bacterium]|nr:DUF6166 domain-containing protein [Actinomycetota bacterium]